MKYKGIIAGLLSIVLLTGFLTEPRVLIEGAAKGMLICSEVIIPSLFPFAVITLFLFSCGFTKNADKIINPLSKSISGLNGENFLIFVFSFLGGFPVGARLIDKSYSEHKISKNTAERMLCYSVNPGPAFVIIGIGQTLLNNTKIGVILFFSGVLASLTVCVALSFLERKENYDCKKEKAEEMRLSDTFVNSVFDSSYSIIAICGFVILFSAVIETIGFYFEGAVVRRILSLLEISNGVALFPGKIAYIAFLLSFSGFCIHFQVLSVCKNIKIKYIRFLFFRIICGFLSVGYCLILLGVFKVDYATLSINKELFDNLTIISFPLSVALIFMSITLLVSVKQNFVEKR